MNEIILKIGEEEYRVPLWKHEEDLEKAVKNACSEVISMYHFAHKTGRHSL